MKSTASEKKSERQRQRGRRKLGLFSPSSVYPPHHPLPTGREPLPLPPRAHLHRGRSRLPVQDRRHSRRGDLSARGRRGRRAHGPRRRPSAGQGRRRRRGSRRGGGRRRGGRESRRVRARPRCRGHLGEQARRHGGPELADPRGGPRGRGGHWSRLQQAAGRRAEGRVRYFPVVFDPCGGARW